MSSRRVQTCPLEVHGNVAEMARGLDLGNLRNAISVTMLFQSQESFTFGCFEYLLVFHNLNQFFAPFGTANHEDAH